MREVSEGLVLDLSVLAGAASQQVGLVDPSFVDAFGRGYMNSALSARHAFRIRMVRGIVKGKSEK